jgi:ferredoxin
MADANVRFSVKVEPKGWQCEASATTTLLQATQQAAIVLPSSCRNGTCRTCICHLHSGKIGYRIEWPGLSAEEKAEGWILPCVAYPESDVIIEVPAALRQP